MEGEIYGLAEAVYSSSPSKEFYGSVAATVAVSASEYVKRFGFDSDGVGAVLDD